MTFLADESDVEASRPREGIEIVAGLKVWRIATGTRDIEIDGETYIASPAQRGEVAVELPINSAELVIHLPVAHPLPRRWLAGTPPSSVTVTVYRKQLRSGEVEEMWRGDATSMTVDSRKQVAAIRVPSRMAVQLDRHLSTVTVGRSCPHVLYDRNCRIDVGDFTFSTTVVNVAGRAIKVASMSGHEDDWATFGKLTHVASGESMTITSQVDVDLQLRAAIYELKQGDVVQVSAGCAHDVATCVDKFANRDNFIGFHLINTYNPFKPTGFGVVVSE